MSTTFEPGTSLAHYRVIAPLGAGGMGEVYKAHDLTLERTVALKILPPELVRNDERVRRFMQEARSASSLNHPNIVTIHEIGQTDTVHYIAMELIDGSTLKRKIHSEETDLRTLLVVLAQAAEGLAKAHGAGIIHRDLKPENIMVTRDGYAKVLDFGLAKLSVKRSADATTDPTAVQHNTREGALLGTVAYMSPEQVQGKTVDHRSDIFSFGCILYEAATRRRPFEADSDVDVMHMIMHDKPVPIDEINPRVPAELRRLIRRCLAKDPEKRYQSMKDLSLELTEIVDEFEELSASASSRTASASNEALAAPARPRTFWGAIAAAGVLALAALAFGIYQWRQAQTVSGPAVPFTSMQFTRLTSSGNITEAAIAPDGKYVAQIILDQAGFFSMAVRQVATGSDVQIIAPSRLPLFSPTFSPDGNYIYYTQYDNPDGSAYGTLFQIPALGGPPRKLAFDVDSRVTFSPDRKKIAFVRGDPAFGKNRLVTASSDGTDEDVVLTYERIGLPHPPAWSPDGKIILVPIRSLEGAAFYALDLGTHRVHAAGSTRWALPGAAAWLPDGSGFVMIASATIGVRPQIWRQPYPAGDPVRVTNDLNEYDGISITSDGRVLASVQVDQQTSLTLLDLAGQTQSRPFTDRMSSVRRPWHLGAAATGAVVVDVENQQGTNVALIDGPGAVPRLITSDGVSTYPSISADGKTIAFQSLRERGVPRIFVMDADGSNVRRLAEGLRPRLSPDGRNVIYTRPDTSLWRVAVAGGEPQRLVERTNLGYAIAPDSTRVAYTYRKNVDNRNVIYLAVMPLAGGQPTTDIALTPFEIIIRWHPTEEAITFLRPAGAINVFAQPLSGGKPKQITNFKTGVITSFDWTADGKLVLTGGEVRADVILISNFR